MAYLYTHKRLDTDAIFYIGIGKDEDNYKRSKSDLQRNNFWKNIVNKTEYSIDIVRDNLTWEQACAFEIELIAHYGRRDMGTGTLVNLTNGGEGCVGKICKPETRAKISASNIGKIQSQESRDKISKALTGRKQSKQALANRPKQEYTVERRESIGNQFRGAKHKCKLVLNTETGIYYESAIEAAEAVGITASNLRQMLRGLYRNKTSLIYV
jgi:hypothetical protein